jgi:hypothetical protein
MSTCTRGSACSRSRPPCRTCTSTSAERHSEQTSTFSPPPRRSKEKEAEVRGASSTCCPTPPCPVKLHPAPSRASIPHSEGA